MSRQVSMGQSQPPVVEAPALDDHLPDAVDVVVIGGGIVGVSTAFFLARKGVSVLVCEKGRVAGEQSSRNWGWVRKMGRDPRELPLMQRSEEIWRQMQTLVGADVGYRETGILYLCENDRDLARREGWLSSAAGFGLDSKMLSKAELDRVLPGSAINWAGGLYTKSDGRTEPQKATPALAAAARRLGARVVAGCAVRGVETTAGRISAAVTEKGRVGCASVVLAGGAWSSLFCGNLGLRLPQLKVLASVMRTAPFEGGPDGAASSASGFAFRKRHDGGYTIANGNVNVADIVPDSFRFLRDFWPAYRVEREYVQLRVGRRFVDELRMPRRWKLTDRTPFEVVRTLSPEPSQEALARAWRRLGDVLPVFKDKGIINCWGGYIDVTPDAVPVISPVEAVPGFFVATGFSGHGFGIGPGAGRLMADLVSGDAPLTDPAPFRFGRFARGQHGAAGN